MLNQNTNEEDLCKTELLTETGSSSSRKGNIKKQDANCKKTRFSKKRIGPYSYHLKDVIGCGFSSVVYKGIKDDDKTHIVAIKVIQLTNLSKNRRHLLSNQVKLMKKLSHPNIVKLLDVQYTINNCYIITEFCEGGSLKHYIDANDNVNTGIVIKQIGAACQYLTSMKIIHRDLKPANVFLKEGVWKLGDFGFSRELPDFDAIVKEDHLIGSPLFMPLEALTLNLYSSKTDSFAMGVFIFYLLTGHYPWMGQNNDELIHQLTNNSLNQNQIHLLPPRIKYYIHSLLDHQIEQRMHLFDCDFQSFTHIKSLKEVEKQLISLKPYYLEQLNLIQYVYQLLCNCSNYQSEIQNLKASMKRHLGKMIQMLQWNQEEEKIKIKQDYSLPERALPFQNQDCHWLNNYLKDAINLIRNTSEAPYEVLLQKLLLYQQIVDCILHGSLQDILISIGKITLNVNFDIQRPDQQLINSMLNSIDFYQL